MNNKQRQQIQTLRFEGMIYTEIGRALGLSLNTVKSFCRRKGIKPRVQDSVERFGAAERAGVYFCAQCGKQLETALRTKPRRFCSDQCRHGWRNKHRDHMRRKAIYYLSCAYCKSDFESYGNKRRTYCCHECYIRARYG